MFELVNTATNTTLQRISLFLKPLLGFTNVPKLSSSKAKVSCVLSRPGSLLQCPPGKWEPQQVPTSTLSVCAGHSPTPRTPE